MLTVCDRGMKSEGRRETKRQAVLEKEETVQEGRKDMEMAVEEGREIDTVVESRRGTVNNS